MKTGIILWCFLLLGCSVMQKKEMQNREKVLSNQHLATSKTFGKFASSNQTIRDSIGADYTLHIKPKGIFRYSAEQGYEGEADQLLVKGRLQRNLKSNVEEETSILVKDTVAQQRTVIQKKDESTVQRERLGFGEWWLLIIIVPGVILVWWLIKR